MPDNPMLHVEEDSESIGRVKFYEGDDLELHNHEIYNQYINTIQSWKDEQNIDRENESLNSFENQEEKEAFEELKIAIENVLDSVNQVQDLQTEVAFSIVFHSDV